MPVQVSYPGVYIQEVSSGSRTITGVSTSIALFVGMADEGPMDKPVRTLSYTEFERTYGVTNSAGELHDQVKQFFLNGGSTCWVIRVANGALPATVELHNEGGTPVLELSAKGSGAFGNSLRVHVDYDTPTPEATFNMTVERMGFDSGGSLTVVASESHKNLSMNPNSSKYAVAVLTQQSALVNAAPIAPQDPQAAYSLWGVFEVSAATTKLEAALNGSSGSFMISVDGSPFRKVTLPAEPAVADIQTQINTALIGTGRSVAVTQEPFGATVHVYKITSNTTGGLIQFAPADSDDICVAMQMGFVNHGIDIGGYAHMRPAPNGLFGQVRADNYTQLEASLDDLLQLDPSAITGIDPNDTLNTDPLVPTGLQTGVHNDFGEAQATLESIRDQINTSEDFPWSAKVLGLRLVLLPEFGGDDADHSAFVTTAGDTTLNGRYFWETGTGNVHRYQLGDFSTSKGTFQNGTQLGTNGNVPVTANYTAAWDTASREIDIYNMMILPRSHGEDENIRQARWGIASVAAKKARAILIVDPPSSWNSIADVSSGVANLRIGVATDHAVVYWPPLKISDGGTLRPIDPAGALAGVMARTDATRGVWKAPAGLDANLLGVRGVQVAMSDADNGVINPEAVNAIRVFPNGIVSWGARTMVGFDNSGNDDYKYLPIRRLALYIEESLYRGLKWAVFEPNDAPLWRQLRASAGAFMNNLFRLGAFAGEKSSDAYFVKVDRETTTQNDINLGIVNVVIGFAPLKPAEFVVITLQQKAGEVQI